MAIVAMTTSRDNREARFWDRMADRYAAQPVPDEAVYRRKLALTAERLTPTDHVLELGCGTGTTAIHHAPHVECYTAIDVSAAMIGIARDKAAGAEVSAQGLEFRVGTVASVAPPVRPYDVVLVHSILHLLDDVPSALEHINRLVRPGGLIIGSTPCIADFFPLFRVIGPIGRTLGLMPRVNVFSTHQFKGWLSDAGHEVEHWWQPLPKSGVYHIARHQPSV